MDAHKSKINEQQAWALVKDAKEVVIAKGQKTVQFAHVSEQQEDILKQMMGPSGNLRAPTLRIAGQFVVGFNAEMYSAIFK